MSTNTAAVAPTLASVREYLLQQQQTLRQQIDVTKASQKEFEAQQRQAQADLTAVERIATAQQTASAAADAATTAADKVLSDLNPKITTPLADNVEATLKGQFDALIGEIKAAKQKVEAARIELIKRQQDQASAQQATAAQTEVVQQKLAALTELPTRLTSLTADLKRQQAELQSAYNAGNLPKAFVLWLDASTTRKVLGDWLQPSFEQGRVQAYTAAVADLATKRQDQDTKEKAVKEQQAALDTATSEQQAAEAARPARLQAIWSDKA